jgi:hypothetical protein
MNFIALDNHVSVLFIFLSWGETMFLKWLICPIGLIWKKEKQGPHSPACLVRTVNQIQSPSIFLPCCINEDMAEEEELKEPLT